MSTFLKLLQTQSLFRFSPALAIFSLCGRGFSIRPRGSVRSFGPNVQSICWFPSSGPEQWFVPQSSSQVYKHSEEGTIPCVVSDPKLNVSLFERPGRTAVGGVRYEPALGFMGRLNDAGHVCVATDGDQEKESQVFYVFTVLGKDTFTDPKHSGPTCSDQLSLSPVCPQNRSR